jgi:eukaryotic-like serine/threonine-protein kinase
LTQPAPDPGTVVEVAPSLLGQVVAGRYRVEALLGEGGMGAVYRAEHVQLEKPVALKVLHPEMTSRPEVVRRFEREALASARIQHPHVVNATDFGKLEDGAFFLVLEYVSGKSLRRAIQERGALPPAQALGLAIQIADALAAAHQAGVVHRDLKPENVMLLDAHEGSVGFVKVLDFGIAKLSSTKTGEAITRHGAIFGTPEYMAPEQARGDKVDERADLYALGIILYELLAGRVPFSAPEIVTVLLKQINDKPPPLPKSVPRALSDYLMSLLAKELGDRPASAQEVAKRLRALAASHVTLEAASAPSSSVRTAFSTSPALAQRLASQIRETALVGMNHVLPLGGRALGSAAALVGRGWRRLWRELLADKRVRWVALGATALPILTVLLVVSQRPEGTASGTLPSLLAPVLPKDDRIERALQGEAEAIAALAAIAPEDRSRAMWLALSQGHEKRGETVQAFEVVVAALAADPELTSESFPSIVRAAVEEPKTRDAALELAARQLGADGVDVLFDVWSGTTGKTPATRAAKKLLDEASVRAKASRAATLALSVRETKGCSEIARLLPKVGEGGDERSLKPLTRLRSKSGCGILQLADCYTCLRKDSALEDAIAEVGKRPAPRFSSKPDLGKPELGKAAAAD